MLQISGKQSYFSMNADDCYHQHSIKWPSTPRPHPTSHWSAAPSGLNWGWMEGGKCMYVWRSRSIGYYHQHTLSKLYGNNMNHSTTWDRRMDGGGRERGSEEKMVRKKRSKWGKNKSDWLRDWRVKKVGKLWVLQYQTGLCANGIINICACVNNDVKTEWGSLFFSSCTHTK